MKRKKTDRQTDGAGAGTETEKDTEKQYTAA